MGSYTSLFGGVRTCCLFFSDFFVMSVFFVLCQMFPVSLDCSFLIVPSILSNVSLHVPFFLLILLLMQKLRKMHVSLKPLFWNGSFSLGPNNHNLILVWTLSVKKESLVMLMVFLISLSTKFQVHCRGNQEYLEKPTYLEVSVRLHVWFTWLYSGLIKCSHC